MLSCFLVFVLAALGINMGTFLSPVWLEEEDINQISNFSFYAHVVNVLYLLADIQEIDLKFKLE